MNKTAQRKLVKNRLLNFNDDGYSEIICAKAFAYLKKYKVTTVMSYCPFQKEVRIDRLNEMLSESAVLLGFPVISETDNQMECYCSKYYSINKYGISQPSKDIYIAKKKLDAVIVPLLAFDQNGNRLGRGKGYYDRYLADFTGLKLAVGFEIQKLQQVAVENNDIVMDVIISEERIYERKD
ncbi:MAG: 5-formyltetrahydrofolate cyclo-ligase [Erysipelotrichaceae bacterium]